MAEVSTEADAITTGREADITVIEFTLTAAAVWR